MWSNSVLTIYDAWFQYSTTHPWYQIMCKIKRQRQTVTHIESYFSIIWKWKIKNSLLEMWSFVKGLLQRHRGSIQLVSKWDTMVCCRLAKPLLVEIIPSLRWSTPAPPPPHTSGAHTFFPAHGPAHHQTEWWTLCTQTYKCYHSKILSTCLFITAVNKEK